MIGKRHYLPAFAILTTRVDKDFGGGVDGSLGLCLATEGTDAWQSNSSTAWRRFWVQVETITKSVAAKPWVAMAASLQPAGIPRCVLPHWHHVRTRNIDCKEPTFLAGAFGGGVGCFAFAGADAYNRTVQSGAEVPGRKSCPAACFACCFGKLSLADSSPAWSMRCKS